MCDLPLAVALQKSEYVGSSRIGADQFARPAFDLHGIEVLKDLAGVGEHLQDHMEVGHVFEMTSLPDKLFRWQNTFMAEAGPQYAAHTDPVSLTENYIPLVIDWFSGHDAPIALHPDLHIRLINVFLGISIFIPTHTFTRIPFGRLPRPVPLAGECGCA